MCNIRVIFLRPCRIFLNLVCMMLLISILFAYFFAPPRPRKKSMYVFWPGSAAKIPVFSKKDPPKAFFARSARDFFDFCAKKCRLQFFLARFARENVLAFAFSRSQKSGFRIFWPFMRPEMQFSLRFSGQNIVFSAFSGRKTRFCGFFTPQSRFFCPENVFL